MIGYVAKDDDGSIWLHNKYPDKEGDYWLSDNMFQLPDYEFPELQNIKEPTKIEINIKRI